MSTEYGPVENMAFNLDISGLKFKLPWHHKVVCMYEKPLHL